MNRGSNMPYTLQEEELVLINDRMSLPIELSKWKDIDDDSDFTNVLKTLKKITDIKGGNPVLVLGTKVVGYDLDKKQHFTFVNQFVDGKHALIGTYDDETKMIYTDHLYLG